MICSLQKPYNEEKEKNPRLRIILRLASSSSNKRWKIQLIRSVPIKPLSGEDHSHQQLLHHSAVTRRSSHGWTVLVAAAQRLVVRVHVRSEAPTSQPDDLYAPAAAGAGDAVPEDALPGRLPPRGGGAQDQPQRGSGASVVSKSTRQVEEARATAIPAGRVANAMSGFNATLSARPTLADPFGRIEEAGGIPVEWRLLEPRPRCAINKWGEIGGHFFVRLLPTYVPSQWQPISGYGASVWRETNGARLPRILCEQQQLWCEEQQLAGTGGWAEAVFGAQFNTGRHVGKRAD